MNNDALIFDGRRKIWYNCFRVIDMKQLIIYIHGMGGNADEAEHYKHLFPDGDVTGFDYSSQTP